VKRCRCKAYEYEDDTPLLHRIPFKCPCGALTFYHEYLVVCTRGHVIGLMMKEEEVILDKEDKRYSPEIEEWVSITKKYWKGEG